MVPSPRKRAAPTTTFNSTWNESDGAFFDPHTMPIAKIPRGWERKQQIKKSSDGKEKTVWRRFNLRSRPDTTAVEESEDDEEQDARSRAVKRRQHMSPKAMEKTSSKLNGKKRAFKATRWDRRKSVLPRKRSARNEHGAIDVEGDASEEEDTTQDIVEGDSTSFAEQDIVMDKCVETNNQNSTFDFTLDAPSVDELPDYESLDGHGEQDVEAEDGTLVNLFRPQTEIAQRASPSKIQHLELPHQEMEATSTTMETTTEEIVATPDNDGTENNEIEGSLPIADAQEVQQVQSEEVIATEHIAEHPFSQGIDSPPSTHLQIAYPSLSTESTDHDSESVHDSTDEAEAQNDELEAHAEEAIVESEHLASNADGLLEAANEDEEFTEASLQLNIQREYQAALQAAQVAPAITQDAQPEMSQSTPDRQDVHDATDDVDQGYISLQTVNEPGAKEMDIDAPVSPDTLQLFAEGDDGIEPQSAPSSDHNMAEAATEDIAVGLTLSLSPSKPTSASPAARKLTSPPPRLRLESEPDDVTMTIALDDDTALLKDFLSRAAASKAEKAATTTHRRESLQNRRDSDVVRHALASPRKALEEKDPNSPSKHDTDITLDLSQTLTLSMPTEGPASPTPGAADTREEKTERASRRSSRTKKSRLPAPASTGPAAAPKIAIRRADGNEVVVLKKDEAKVLADLTRSNTRKNKQGAFGVTVRLMKLAIDDGNLPPVDDSTRELIIGKNIRWDEQLAYYQENPDTVANLLAEAESLSTPDELSMLDTTPKAKKEKTSRTSTPKIRRVRGLGTANGTPAKGLLAPASLLPEAVQEEKEQTATQQLPKPRSGKAKKMPVASSAAPATTETTLSSTATDTKLPALDVAPVGLSSHPAPAPAPAAQRKSRLAAPKKIVLPQTQAQTQTSLLTTGEGKENASVKTGLQTKKGIPAPKVVVKGPTAGANPGAGVGMEAGLPRRRGRKL